jgi:hypothetical protein
LRHYCGKSRPVRVVTHNPRWQNRLDARAAYLQESEAREQDRGIGEGSAAIGASPGEPNDLERFGKQVMRDRTFLCTLLLWLALSGADPGVAQDYYGAIAYSPSTRSHGWSSDHATRREAESRALANCRRHAGDCVIPAWFRNGCGALADGPKGYGSAWGASRSLAENYALQGCRRRSSGCAIVRWVCTAPGPAEVDGGSRQ